MSQTPTIPPSPRLSFIAWPAHIFDQQEIDWHFQKELDIIDQQNRNWHFQKE
jgi:hypothetical protein